VEIRKKKNFQVISDEESCRKIKAKISSGLTIFKIEPFILFRMAAKE